MRRREEGRERRARRGEAHLDQVGAGHRLDAEVVEVAVEEARVDLLRRVRVVLLGRRRRSARPAPRAEEVEHPAARPHEPSALGRGPEEGRILGEPAVADHALGQVTAPERRHLRREEARASGGVAIELELALFHLEAKRGLMRHLEASRGGVGARDDERHEDRQPDGQAEAGPRQPAIAEEEPRAVPETLSADHAEIRVHDLAAHRRDVGPLGPHDRGRGRPFVAHARECSRTVRGAARRRRRRAGHQPRGRRSPLRDRP